MISQADAEQYIRLTCKQYGVHIPVYFCMRLTQSKRTMGFYRFHKRNAFAPRDIRLSHETLASFPLLHHVLMHEICHYLDNKERGKMVGNGRRLNCHGPNFKKWCRKVGIVPTTFVPKNLMPTKEQSAAIRQKIS